MEAPEVATNAVAPFFFTGLLTSNPSCGTISELRQQQNYYTKTAEDALIPKKQDLPYSLVKDPVTGREKKLYMYEAIIGKAPEGMVIDFIDGDTTNHQRHNLRFVSKRMIKIQQWRGPSRG